MDVSNPIGASISLNRIINGSILEMLRQSLIYEIKYLVFKKVSYQLLEEHLKLVRILGLNSFCTN